MRRFLLACSAALLLCTALPAQSFSTAPCSGDEGNTNNNSWSLFGRQEKFCEVRRATLPLVNGQLNVSGTNGGIEVIGEGRRDIYLEARVMTQGSNRDQAISTAHQIRIVTNGSIHAEGPSASGLFGHSWSVNFKLRVPRHLAAQLHTENGGIDISTVEGTIHADTTNGGVTLNDLAGEVHASTVNGGLDVRLAGKTWRGAGLRATSVNGGVSISAPDGYSAHLIASTVNGGISVAFPITVQGAIRNHLDTNLGAGGPTLQFETTNGGVSVGRGSDHAAREPDREHRLGGREE